MMFGFSPVMMGRKTLKYGDFYQGGFYLGDISYGGNDYLLLVAVKATEIARQWSTASGTTGVVGIYDGLANTDALNSAPYPAALYASALSSNGYGDWYLPAQEELKIINPNRSLLPSGEGLESAWYWSSTELGSTAAFAMNGSSGDSVDYGKTNTGGRVRAIRRVLA